MAVCRKFELDLGDKGLIYHVFVQPSVFFSASLKNRRSLGLYFNHRELHFKFEPLFLHLFHIFRCLPDLWQIQNLLFLNMSFFFASMPAAKMFTSSVRSLSCHRSFTANLNQHFGSSSKLSLKFTPLLFNRPMMIALFIWYSFRVSGTKKHLSHCEIRCICPLLIILGFNFNLEFF